MRLKESERRALGCLKIKTALPFLGKRSEDKTGA